MNYLLTTGSVALAIGSYLYYDISESFICLALLLSLLFIHVQNEIREQPAETFRQFNFFVIVLTLFVFLLVTAYLIRWSLIAEDISSVVKYGFMALATFGTAAFFLGKRF